METDADPIRWGIVSTGNIARKMTAELRLLPDARLSADGVLVALHDDHLDRVSDGRGLVSEHRAAEIAQYLAHEIVEFCFVDHEFLPAVTARS